MKQRIRVVGLVRREGEILVLKKSRGRSEFLPKWGLLTSKIEFGEQPEEAMSRALQQYLGVTAEKMKLSDVVTFLAMDGASRASNLYIVYEVELAPETRPQLLEKYVAYKFVKDFDKFNDVLETYSAEVLEIEVGLQKTRYREAVNGAMIFVDGASKGNPGPSGIGYYIIGEDGKEIKRGGEFIGFATSRVAEYYAMKEGIEQALELGIKNVRFVGDNLMMINQLKGLYKVKNSDLMQIYNDIQVMLAKFESCAFIHVNRERNAVADAEANKAIARQFEDS